jgi:DNA-binding NarL/FixJ family response regulator
MALVLCTGIDGALLETRRLILESAGHTVVSVTTETALRSACENHVFDVAVIGQAMTARIKARIATMVREHCPAVKVLELYEPHQEPAVADADAWLLVPSEAPTDLADRVKELASKRRGHTCS